MVNVNLWVWAGSSMGQNSEMFNLSQALLPGPSSVLNPPLTGTGVKSAPALILPAFGWAESFPGNARISPKLQVESYVITYCTDVCIQAKESHPGLQRMVCPHFFPEIRAGPTSLTKFYVKMILGYPGRQRVSSTALPCRWWMCNLQALRAELSNSEPKGKAKADLSQSLTQTKLSLPCWAPSGCEIALFSTPISAAVRQHKMNILMPPPPPLSHAPASKLCSSPCFLAGISPWVIPGWNFGLELFKLWSREENDPFWAVGKLWRGESRAEAGPGTGK